MTPAFRALDEAAGWYDDWLREAALPLWTGAGLDGRGGFRDLVTSDGRPVDGPRRARVQARQVFVLAQAGTAGYGEALTALAVQGYDAFVRDFRRPDGLFACRTDAGGRVIDDTPRLYEQDFGLLAMSALATATGEARFAEDAARTRAALEAYRHPAGGLRELGDHPFQANANMHLFETALAWEAVGGGAWAALADEVAELALARFIDLKGGFLREFFDADWRAAAGDDGRWVEPGHQFEWAWLLERWSRLRGEPRAAAAARRLFICGLRGVDREREVAVNCLWDDLSVRDAGARLWPQTEYLKAALILGEEAEALTAARGLAKYLETPVRGVWRDRLQPGGTFVDEPAPASSFYHIWMGIAELVAYVRR